MCSGKTVLCQNRDPLLFSKDEYKVESVNVVTSSGEKKVIYRAYMHIPYVSNPVDKDYESLNVIVPIRINDKNIDATDAPILLEIGVGGYLSSSNVRSGISTGSNINRMTPDYKQISNNAGLALASGFVVVMPGCRGRENKTADGIYYGKAPAAIADLKAAVRYLHYNKGIVPGNPDRIISTGVSAGGALSALLGASGNNHLYDPFLRAIGAADASDNIFGSACFCPITDLDHADEAYEWMYGPYPTGSGVVDQDLSKQLKESFADYQKSLNLQGKNDFGTITADNYDKYLLQYFLIPSASNYLKNLTEEKRKDYLNDNKWITWNGNEVSFSFQDYVKHVGRMKGLPAFDDFDMKQPEPIEFGNKTTNARHFTDFSLRRSSGNKGAELDNGMKLLINMMNAMYFIGQNNTGCTNYWWLRQGTSDNHTSQTVIVNLATMLENKNKDVNISLYWDAGHGANQDAEDFMKWIGKITGYSNQISVENK